MTQLLDRHLIETVLDAARQSPRRRMNHNFHSGPQDNPHRFLNVLLKHTYVAPHRHIAPPKAESFIVLEGEVMLWCFDDDGNVTERHHLGTIVRGADVAPGTWHTLTAITEAAVCFEVKPGPWDAASDKDFATWAPREGDPQAAAYLEGLLQAL